MIFFCLIETTMKSNSNANIFCEMEVHIETSSYH